MKNYTKILFLKVGYLKPKHIQLVILLIVLSMFVLIGGAPSGDPNCLPPAC